MRIVNINDKLLRVTYTQFVTIVNTPVVYPAHVSPVTNEYFSLFNINSIFTKVSEAPVWVWQACVCNKNITFRFYLRLYCAKYLYLNKGDQWLKTVVRLLVVDNR